METTDIVLLSERQRRIQGVISIECSSLLCFQSFVFHSRWSHNDLQSLGVDGDRIFWPVALDLQSGGVFDRMHLLLLCISKRPADGIPQRLWICGGRRIVLHAAEFSKYRAVVCCLDDRHGFGGDCDQYHQMPEQAIG